MWIKTYYSNQTSKFKINTERSQYHIKWYGSYIIAQCILFGRTEPLWSLSFWWSFSSWWLSLNRLKYAVFHDVAEVTFHDVTFPEFDYIKLSVLESIGEPLAPNNDFLDEDLNLKNLIPAKIEGSTWAGLIRSKYSFQNKISALQLIAMLQFPSVC